MRTHVFFCFQEFCGFCPCCQFCQLCRFCRTQTQTPRNTHTAKHKTAHTATYGKVNYVVKGFVPYFWESQREPRIVAGSGIVTFKGGEREEGEEGRHCPCISLGVRALPQCPVHVHDDRSSQRRVSSDRAFSCVCFAFFQ